MLTIRNWIDGMRRKGRITRKFRRLQEKFIAYTFPELKPKKGRRKGNGKKIRQHSDTG